MDGVLYNYESIMLVGRKGVCCKGLVVVHEDMLITGLVVEVER